MGRRILSMPVGRDHHPVSGLPAPEPGPKVHGGRTRPPSTSQAGGPPWGGIMWSLGPTGFCLLTWHLWVQQDPATHGAEAPWTLWRITERFPSQGVTAYRPLCELVKGTAPSRQAQPCGKERRAGCYPPLPLGQMLCSVYNLNNQTQQPWKSGGRGWLAGWFLSPDSEPQPPPQ